MLFRLARFEIVIHCAGAIRPSRSSSGNTPPSVISATRFFGKRSACSTTPVSRLRTVKSSVETSAVWPSAKAA